MKTLLLVVLSFFSTKIYSQESIKIREIDSLASIIRLSNLPVQHDTISQEYPGLALSIKTYLTIMIDSKELKKYVSKVRTVQQENGVPREMITGTAFYYDQNKLIKVEEFALQDEKEQLFAWYFSGNKCFYHTLQSDKAESRALLLLTMSNSISKKIIPQN